jgi:hypothetical protein
MVDRGLTGGCAPAASCLRLLGLVKVAKTPTPGARATMMCRTSLSVLGIATWWAMGDDHVATLAEGAKGRHAVVV